MHEGKAFSINQLDDDTVQIYGKVNGFAYKRPWPGEMAGSYAFSIKFFTPDGRLLKVMNSEKDGTVRRLETLVDRISKIYDAEFYCVGSQ